MKKGFCLLLMLCILLTVSCALAAEAYVPGARTDALYTEAWNAGKMITGDMQLVFTPSAELLAADADDAALLSALSDVLRDTTLSVGAGKLDDGVRIELGGQYAPANAKGLASIDLAMELTYDGLRIESSLLEDNQLTVSWSTLLAICGVDEETAEWALSLRDVNFAAVWDEMTTQLRLIGNQAALLAAPYVSTISSFIVGLPCDVQTDVPADGYYPAVAQKLTLSITASQIGELIDMLADQLEADDTVSAILDQLLANSESLDDAAVTVDVSGPASTAELCAAMRQFADEACTGDTPLLITVGLDEDGAPCYLVLEVLDDTYSLMLDAVAYVEDGAISLQFDAVVCDLAAESTSGVMLALQAVPDEHDPYTMEGSMVFTIVEEDVTLLTCTASASSASIVTEDGLPAVTQSTYIRLGENAEADLLTEAIDAVFALTADDGERISESVAATLLDSNTLISFTFAMEHTIAPTEDGGLTGSALMLYEMSELGIDEWGVRTAYRTNDRAPMALNVVALETATEDELSALADMAAQNAESFADTLLSLLPSEIAQLLVQEEADIEAAIE